MCWWVDIALGTLALWGLWYASFMALSVDTLSRFGFVVVGLAGRHCFSVPPVLVLGGRGHGRTLARVLEVRAFIDAERTGVIDHGPCPGVWQLLMSTGITFPVCS